LSEKNNLEQKTGITADFCVCYIKVLENESVGDTVAMLAANTQVAPLQAMQAYRRNKVPLIFNLGTRLS